MKKAQILGLILLIAGILLVALSSMFESLQKLDLLTIPVLMLFAGTIIIIGVIVLLLSIIFEQTRDMNKRKQEIKKEDFEP
ncbi:MAG: hypothetical protein QXL17_01495 [Candidatus Thermoplasmatota archaeon]